MDREAVGRLVRRARSGDERAFEDLVVLHQKPLYGFLYRLSGDMETAKELTQRALVKAWFSLRSFRGDAAFGTWLHSIGINAWRNHLRDEGRRRHLPLDETDPWPDTGAPGALEELEGRERAVRLERALFRLPPRQKEALTLRVQEELPFQEVARVMGCTEGAAKASFHHAVEKLKAAMREEEP